jgi:hypothetical protein
LGNYTRANGVYSVFIGNKKIVTLKPQYFEISDNCPDRIELEVDKKRISVSKATDIFVNDDFRVIKQNGIRVNVIGFTSNGISDESGIDIHKSSLNKKFSVDNENKTYRVEFYKGDEFCSMSMVHFK